MKINGELLNKKVIIIGLLIIFFGVLILIWLLSRTLTSGTIQPSEARLYLDNNPITIGVDGKFKKFVPSGTHTFKLEAENYISYSKTVYLPKAGGYKLEITLQKKPNAIVLLDGDKAVTNIDLIKYDNTSNSLYYFAESKTKLYQTKLESDGNGTIVAKQNHLVATGLSGINETIWSPKVDSILFKKNDGYYFFDLQKINLVDQKETKFGDNIGDLAWSPDDSKIAYYYTGNGEQSLIFADKRNQNVERVLNLRENGINNPYLSWSPNSEWLIIIPRNSDLATNKIYLFNAYTRQLSVINNSGNNIEAKFSEDGGKILYSTFSKSPSSAISSVISIMNSDGNEQRSTDIRAILEQAQWLGGDNLLAAYFNQDSATEEIGMFSISSKMVNGSTFALPRKVYLAQILNTKNSITVFTVNNTLYGMNLK